MHAKIARSGPGSHVLVSGRETRRGDVGREKERKRRKIDGGREGENGRKAERVGGGENKMLTPGPLIINGPCVSIVVAR